MNTGQGGKTLNDRKLAAEVRTLSLKEMKKVLEDDSEDNKDYKKQLVLKLAATVLPRLTEISGPDGGDVPMPIYGGQSVKTFNENPGYNSNQENISAE